MFGGCKFLNSFETFLKVLFFFVCIMLLSKHALQLPPPRPLPRSFVPLRPKPAATSSALSPLLLLFIFPPSSSTRSGKSGNYTHCHQHHGLSELAIESNALILSRTE
ncbi:hypothetical protein QBC43DRAFT_324040 [Cladorrhinum sp. PSN259]|nr:hypothetical protein QBC43DRAFT_324040 [Cladorrhinum sp. PSN259]